MAREAVPEDLMRWRREFAVMESCVYLDNAAVAPMPRRTVAVMTEAVAEVAAHGGRRWAARMQEIERVRGLVASLLGAAREHEVAFTANTATGLSLVAEGLDWQPGDNVVGIACEFPSNVYPWLGLAARGVEYRAAAERDGRIDVGELASLVDRDTRVVAVSWVQYASGFRLGLRRLGAFCREHGVLLVVDVIQGLGALSLDVERDGIDACAAATHKWLLGPEGLGLLYVSDRVVDRLQPRVRGWASVGHRTDWERHDLTWSAGAKRFEGGTFNVAAIHGLGASLELLAEVGPARVERRVLALAERVAVGLAARGWRVVGRDRVEEASGIVAAEHPELDAAAAVRTLRREQIIVSERAGRLRVAPHFYNTEDEIDRLLDRLPG